MRSRRVDLDVCVQRAAHELSFVAFLFVVAGLVCAAVALVVAVVVAVLR